jgi:hypothetical protein
MRKRQTKYRIGSSSCLCIINHMLNGIRALFKVFKRCSYQMNVIVQFFQRFDAISSFRIKNFAYVATFQVQCFTKQLQQLPMINIIIQLTCSKLLQFLKFNKRRYPGSLNSPLGKAMIRRPRLLLPKNVESLSLLSVGAVGFGTGILEGCERFGDSESEFSNSG